MNYLKYFYQRVPIKYTFLILEDELFILNLIAKQKIDITIMDLNC